ncbi:MAG TPA: AAA family ATPase [Chloroflexota bacterium]|nr:AAA family ATPase [Chloroflexota bacterium]
MNPKIETLTIERFRALRQLRIEGLGRVNLITGRNNTGKSSVLEALRIFSDASPSVIADILRYREEYVGESEEATRSVEGEDFAMISSLFSGFPSPGEISGPIAISTNGFGRPQRLSLSVERVAEERLPDGTRRFVPQQARLFPDVETQLALIIDAEAGRRILTLQALRRFLTRPGLSVSPWPEKPRFPCVDISPYGSEHTSELGPLWDNVALSDREKDVVDALRIITPDVVAVSMIGGERLRRSRTAIVRTTSIPHPVPLRSFGDGLNRLFGIVLSLVNAKDGLLLIDEVENGMHYTVQLALWRAIFELSHRLNVQVFATSHSWDSVESFQQAASEAPDEGVLIRLSRKGDDIIPTPFRENELAVATRDRIEVR